MTDTTTADYAYTTIANTATTTPATTTTNTGYYGSTKLREKRKFANFSRNLSLARSLWEQKVARKV